MHEIDILQVMAQVHREGDVGARESVPHGVGLEYGNGRADQSARIEVDTEGLDAKLAPHAFEDRAGRASYIKDAADRQWIPANRPDDEGGITQEIVDSGNIPIRALHQFVRNTIGVQDFRFVLPLHPPDYRQRS